MKATSTRRTIRAAAFAQRHLLLCSDGLTDLLWNDEILEVIRSRPTLKEASKALIEMANSRRS